MDRDEVAMISKKRKVDKNLPTLESDNSSKVAKIQSKFVDDVVYRLYFKGLVSNNKTTANGGEKTTVSGLGIAICDEKDELLFQMDEKVNDVEGVEIRALIRGLSESLDLGIKKLVIYCDDDQIYQYIKNGECNPKEESVDKQLLEEVKGHREKFASSVAVLVTRNDIKFAYELAREAIVSQISSSDGDGDDNDNDNDGDGDNDNDGGGDYDDNPWAHGCGCDHLNDSPPDPNYFDYDFYIDYYSL